MKRDTRHDDRPRKQRLALGRQTLRPLHDDAMHQVRGGAGAGIDSGLMAEMAY